MVRDCAGRVCGYLTAGATYRVRTGRLGTTGALGHDDLVNGKDGPGGLGGKLDGPVLGDEEVEDALLLRVKNAGVVIVL